MYSYNNQYPISELPHRIRLSDGMTKTDPSTFTEEDIAYAGFTRVDDPPEYDVNTQRLTWEVNDGVGTWKVVNLTQEEMWQPIREKRNKLMNEFEWRISRYNRENISGTPLTDANIVHMYEYMQALADITKQEDPLNIVWPVYNAEE